MTIVTVTSVCIFASLLWHTVDTFIFLIIKKCHSKLSTVWKFMHKDLIKTVTPKINSSFTD